MNDEQRLRLTMCRLARSMFERGLTSGSSGNLSARVADGLLMTPTNSCLGFLDPDRLSKLDTSGRHVSGDKPTKEIPLHLSFYEARPQAMGIVHLHSTYATALSCRADVDPQNVLPALTPYVLMRAGRVPLLPYTQPGSADVRPFILAHAPRHAAVLLANHGPVVSGESFEAAVYAAEEIEEAAKLFFILQGQPLRILSDADVERLLKR
jgi:ribulose-5-phosphate 4-epimerase/fuculose-1-phosphate aldolase